MSAPSFLIVIYNFLTFNINFELIVNYLEWLDALFVLYDIHEYKLYNIQILLGAKVNLVSSETVISTSYDHLVNIIIDHFSLAHLQDMERYKFYKTDQLLGESVKGGNFLQLDEILRNCSVADISHEVITTEHRILH